MKPLTEEDVRRIAREEMMKDYNSGNPLTNPHEHNGNDGLQLDPALLLGWGSIPMSTQKYNNYSINISGVSGIPEYGFGSPQQLIGGSSTNASQYVNNPKTAMYQIPLIVGNGRISGQAQGDFAGGYAPEATLIAFSNGVTMELHIRFDGQWYGVDLPIIT